MFSRHCLLVFGVLQLGCLGDGPTGSGLTGATPHLAEDSCDPPLPPASPSPIAAPGSPSQELVAGGTAEFGSIANLPADPYCSDSDFSRIDGCINRQNPPMPSVTRRVGASRARDHSDTVSPYLAGHQLERDTSMTDYATTEIYASCEVATMNGAQASCFRDSATPWVPRCFGFDTVHPSMEACQSSGALICYLSSIAQTTIVCGRTSNLPVTSAMCPPASTKVSSCADVRQNAAPIAPRAGDRAILPWARSSNDGRLQLNPGYQDWPYVSYFRPEALNQDLVHGAARTSEEFMGGVLHPLTWFNPADTDYSVRGAPGVTSGEVVQLQSNIDVLHGTICDHGTQNYALEGSSAGSQTHIRSVVACSARYGDFPYDQALPTEEDLEVMHGLCYRISFLASASVSSHWELRSNALTVFVPNVYRATSGGDMWVFPENPENVFAEQAMDGEVRLPDFAPYDLPRVFPFARMGTGASPINVMALVTSPVTSMGHALDVPTNCYLNVAGTWSPNPSAPSWCAFVFSQHRVSEFYFDNDHDAAAERFPEPGLTYWNGRQPTSHHLFELSTTGDGLLMLVNENDALYYSTNNVGACRADGFQSLLPYSLMPVDPILRSRGYAIALITGGHEFQDPSGEPIPFGSLQRFAYPWIDRAGTNLFFSAVNEQRDAYYTDSFRRLPHDARFGTPPITPAFPPDPEVPARRRGLNARAGHQVSVLGGWTHGRVVVLDNGLNASDFGGVSAEGKIQGSNRRIFYTHEYSLNLYSDRTLRFIPNGVSMLSSFENRLNYLEAMRPHLPFDVVWSMTGNNQTMSEVVFDDYLDRRGFAVVHMNAALRFRDEPTLRSTRGASLVSVEDGFVSQSSPWSDQPNYIFNTGEIADSRPSSRPNLQNAAPFSTVEQVRLRGGARIEPVALGGVLGRGVFLDGVNDFIEMNAPNVQHSAWYLGLWVEPHPNPVADVQQVFHFPGGSFVGLRRTRGGFNLVAFAKNPDEFREVPLGALIQPRQFSHLGMRTFVRGTNRIVELYVDGTKVSALTFGAGSGAEPRGFSVMRSCVSCAGEQCECASTSMIVGAPQHGQLPGGGVVGPTTGPVRGWVDELRIYQLMGPDWTTGAAFEEQMCNFALGTLVSVRTLNGRRLQQAFIANTGNTPLQVCEQLVLEQYDEPFDLPRQHGRTTCAGTVHQNGDPSTGCLRPDFLGLPLLVAQEPRPSTSSNHFCLNCHSGDANIAGLGLGALASDINQTPRYADFRRQPMNPPAVLALPRSDCDTHSLDDTWYARYPLESNPIDPVGTWLTDPVVDGTGPLRPGPH